VATASWAVLSMSHLACTFALYETKPSAAAAELVIDSPLAARFVVEIADTQHKRTQGLMERVSLAPDHGMLFIFDHQSNHGLWMKNTYLSLDMIFFDNDFRVVGVRENTQPLSLEIVTINQDSRYVLEVLAGTAKKYGIDLTSKARLVYE